MSRLPGTLIVGLVTLAALAAAPAAEKPGPRQESAENIRHSFLALGGETYIVGEDSQVKWTYPHETRDGFVLPSGNVLLALSKGKDLPGGGVAEVMPDGKVVFEYKGTKSEVDTAQLLADDRILLTESGAKPRLLEVDRTGKILVEVPLQCQTKDHHMETRMARKLANGNYLVPHLIDRVVREYTPEGKVVWEVATPHWPFTAIRLENGNTLINCTMGMRSIEVDAKGKTVWDLTNADLGGDLIKDACGGQRLANGNTVITSYRTGVDDVKMFEVTREKKVVWTYKDGKGHGIHHFQILTTNGKKEEGAMK